MTHTRRAHSRRTLAVDVRLHLADGRVVEGVTRDLSAGGAFVIAPIDARFGDELEIELTLPGHVGPSRLEATIRWVDEGGLGMQFAPMRARHIWGINKLLGALERERPSTLPPP